MQFLVLVDDEETDEHCEELDRLYQCLDEDSSDSSASSRVKSAKKDNQKDR